MPVTEGIDPDDDTFCGVKVQHDTHLYRLKAKDWRISDLFRFSRAGIRRCDGAYLTRCGRDAPHPAHWVGEFNDELCTGVRAP